MPFPHPCLATRTLIVGAALSLIVIPACSGGGGGTGPVSSSNPDKDASGALADGKIIDSAGGAPDSGPGDADAASGDAGATANPHLCEPCKASNACRAIGVGGGVCVTYGDDGSFCAVACVTSADCTSGYTCRPATTAEGKGGDFCVKAVADGSAGKGFGACACSKAAISGKLATFCKAAAEIDGVQASCTGQRICTDQGLSDCDAPTPAAETCNGLDDDCDGQTDEAPAKAQCGDGDPCFDADCVGGKCAKFNKAGGCDLDGNPCTDDLCKDGGCVAGPPKKCDDARACTVDACDPKTGDCTHIPRAEGTACADGDPCTDDTCKAGLCHGVAKKCDDGDPCTDDSCGDQGCSHLINTAACEDGDPCTLGDLCSFGICKPGKPKVCDDANPCTDGACKAGQCESAANADSCDDGSACTAKDGCEAGKCAGEAISCDDDNACTTDKCDPQLGCTHDANSAPCDDGSACTEGDQCKGGKCLGGPAVVCDDANPCTDDACEPATGCTATANAEGCDDGDVCTSGDACVAGTCAPGANVCACHKDADCQQPTDPCLGKRYCDKTGGQPGCKLNPATVVKCSQEGVGPCAENRCDPKTGTCGLRSIHEDRACDADGDPCTGGDLCKGGKCLAGKPLSCDDQNPCTDDACVAGKGCSNVGNVAPCDADGNPCTVQDTCSGKVCVAGGARICHDGKKCTRDSCDAKTGVCRFTAIVGCGGNCGSAKDCDDDNLCTTDTCTAHKCANTPVKDATDCDDGDVCTSGDACVQGVCDGSKKVCTDANPCTNDGCDPAKGCVFLVNSAPCDDFDLCTLGDTCEAGKCTKHTPKKCDDGDKCTTDHCNPGTGACLAKGIPGCGGYCDAVTDCDDKEPCTVDACKSGKCDYTTLTGVCDDGDKCTVGEKCTGGKCGGATAKDCDDANPCTLDRCNKNTAQCEHQAVSDGGACDDGDACTVKSVCGTAAGKTTCSGAAKSCDDGNTCTKDRCDAKTGACLHPAADGAGCEDGNACTVGDHCAGGKCVVGTGVVGQVLAGTTTPGQADGKGGSARFNLPHGLALARPGAAFSAGNPAYIADADNHRIRRLLPDGTLTTVAGSSQAGLLDGLGAKAWFNSPRGLAADAKGTIYVADRLNHAVRTMTAKGEVRTLAGKGTAGVADGPVAKARFNQPWGIAATSSGVLYVSGFASHRIRRVAAGAVSTVAGLSAGFADGKGTAARFRNPMGVALDRDAALWVADYGNHRLRRVMQDGTVTTMAGSGAGYVGGKAGLAKFRNLRDVAVEPGGRVLIADYGNNRLRFYEAPGIVGTISAKVPGTGSGFATANPTSVLVDIGGNLLLTDRHRVVRIIDSTAPCAIGGQCYRDAMPNPDNGCERCIAAAASTKWSVVKEGAACKDGDLCTGAEKCASGACKGAKVSCDDGDKCTTDSCDNATGGCAFKPIVGCGGHCAKDADCDDKNGCTDDHCDAGKCTNDPNTAACDDGNPCTAGDRCSGGTCTAGDKTWMTTLAGSTRGYKDGKGGDALLDRPFGVFLDDKGIAWVADTFNQVIRKVMPDGTTTTYAGRGNDEGLVNGSLEQARFRRPYGITGPGDGSLYVADSGNHVLRRIDAKGQVITFAGSLGGFADGKATDARFNYPIAVAAARGGVLYVADYGNHRVRRVMPDGTVSTVAGSTRGFADGPGAKARFNYPRGITVRADGMIVVGDYLNHRVRLVTPSGAVSTLAGTGTQGYSDGPAAQATFRYPRGVAADSAGNVYVADRNNHRIRRISPQGFVTTFAGGKGTHPLTDGDVASTARMRYPTGLSVNAHGRLAMTQEVDDSVRVLFASAGSCAIGGACWVGGEANPAKTCERCDAAKSRKAWSAKSDGAPCDDGKGCTVHDACKSGLCAGAPLNCDDGSKCTTDSCNALTGACVHLPIVGCDGFCQTAADCDDHNPCTDDTCPTGGPGAGKCATVPNSEPCEDGDPCSLGDTCAGGKCGAGSATMVDTVAGSKSGLKDGAVADALLHSPYGVAIDSAGNLYVADLGNSRIRKVAPGGTVSTYAGSTSGFHDGEAASARFSQPSDVAIAPAGGLVVADRGNQRIRLIDKAGKVTTLAGTSYGYSDAKGSNAAFRNPWGIGVTAAGVVWVADYSNEKIRRIDPDGSVTTLAGSSAGLRDGKGGAAQFRGPIDVAPSPATGVLYVADYRNHSVRRVTPEGVVTTLAGNGSPGAVDAIGEGARFRYPRSLAVGPTGLVWVADQHNHRVRTVDAKGRTRFVAGIGAGFADGDDKTARLYYPSGIAVAANGAVYLGDRANHRIRRLRVSAGVCRIGGMCWGTGVPKPADPCLSCVAASRADGWTARKEGDPCDDGQLCTAGEACKTGKCTGSPVSCDDGDKCTTDACDPGAGGCRYTRILGCNGYCQEDADCDDGNPCTLGHRCVAEQCKQGPVDLMDTIAGTGAAGSDDGPADKASFRNPSGLCTDGAGGWFVADSGNHRIRRVAKDGTVTTFAGSGKAGLFDAKGTKAWFNSPSDLVADGKGGALVADRYTHTLRAVASDGTVTTFAGNGVAASVDGKGGKASFNQPIGLARAATNTVYVSGYGSHRIRKLLGDGTVSTVAGSTAGFQDGKGSAARFFGPIGVAVGASGNLLVADHLNNRIRRIAPDGTVTTVAGTGTRGNLDGGLATATFNRPWGVGRDSSGRILVTDQSHHLRQIHGGFVETIAGSYYGHLDGPALTARFRNPTGLHLDAGGTVRIADHADHRIRRLRRTAHACSIDGACWIDGASKPGDPCRVCDGAKSPKAWSKSAAATCPKP